ncbi:MAG: hypothetical protein KKD01_20015 [Proteobacteria bacterium]|nr:hypothetical protein [Pseudomonadota bacterium]
MTLTPEIAAERIPGRYTVWDVMSIADLDRWGMMLHEFMALLLASGVAPCMTCGAYRKADKCKVCEEVEK